MLFCLFSFLSRQAKYLPTPKVKPPFLRGVGGICLSAPALHLNLLSGIVFNRESLEPTLCASVGPEGAFGLFFRADVADGLGLPHEAHPLPDTGSGLQI